MLFCRAILVIYNIGPTKVSLTPLKLPEISNCVYFKCLRGPGWLQVLELQQYCHPTWSWIHSWCCSPKAHHESLRVLMGTRKVSIIFLYNNVIASNKRNTIYISYIFSISLLKWKLQWSLKVIFSSYTVVRCNYIDDSLFITLTCQEFQGNL